MKREDILKQAMQVICNDREGEYGSPKENFSKIAWMWSDYIEGYNFSPSDVCMMMALVKMSRIKTGKPKADSFVDIAGYAALGAEVSENLVLGGGKSPCPVSGVKLANSEEVTDKLPRPIVDENGFEVFK